MYAVKKQNIILIDDDLQYNLASHFSNVAPACQKHSLRAAAGFNCHGWADELHNNWTFSRESSFCSAVPLKPPLTSVGGGTRGRRRRGKEDASCGESEIAEERAVPFFWRPAAGKSCSSADKKLFPACLGGLQGHLPQSSCWHWGASACSHAKHVGLSPPCFSLWDRLYAF